MRTNAVRIHETGDASKLVYEEIDVKDPAENEVLIRNKAIGVNFIDTYHRSGLYKIELPATLGMDGCGVIEKLGANVTDFKIGDLVAYSGPIGSYAKHVLRPAEKLIKIPKFIDDKTAASIMVKGLTAQYLCRQTFKVKKGDVILIQAAAGGVGQILTQWTKYLGATVIATVGSAEKIAIAKAAGADHVILSQENFAQKVREITNGKGVDVVYDGIGKATFMNSLDCLKPRGLMVSYGNASGAVDPINIQILSQKNSIFLTRPTLMSYTQNRAELLAAVKDLFAIVKKKIVKINVNHAYALKDAAQAHKDLENRKTTGSIVLIP